MLQALAEAEQPRTSWKVSKPEMNDQTTPSAGYNKKLAVRASIAFIVVCVLYGGAKGFLESYYDARNPVKVRATAKAINRSVDSISDDDLKVAMHHTKDTMTPAEKEHFTRAMGACNQELREGLTAAPPTAAPMAPAVNP